MDQPTNDATSPPASATANALPAHLADAPPVSHALFRIGDKVKHRVFGFRGVVFDIDPEFDNTEDWWLAIPAEVRPRKDQPFYHLLAENEETEYIAYVSEQNLLPDTSGEPLRHSQISEIFETGHDGTLVPRPRSMH